MAKKQNAAPQPAPKKQVQAVKAATTYASAKSAPKQQSTSAPKQQSTTKQTSTAKTTKQTSTAKTTNKNEVLKNALKGVGTTLSTFELERIKKQTGIKGGIIPFATSLGIKSSYGIKQQTGGNKGGGTKIPGFTGSSAEGYNPEMFEAILAQNLASLGGNISADVARIMSAAEVEKAKIANRGLLKSTQITADSSDYATEAEERSKTYDSDRQLESILGAENVRSKGAIDLQAIINAGATNIENIRSRGAIDLQGVVNTGAANVENIRSKGAIDLQGIVNTGAANVENIRGKYGVEGKKIDRRAAILSSLTSAFNF